MNTHSMTSIWHCMTFVGVQVLVFWSLLTVSVATVTPDELLQDPTLATRAQNLYKNLRCLVCQGQSIHESNAPIAQDIRLFIRESLLNGKSDSEILTYLVDRYGDSILMRPPVQKNTLLLWLAPILFLLFGVVLSYSYFRSAHSKFLP